MRALRPAAVAALCALAGARSIHAQDSALVAAQAALARRIATSGATVGLYAVDLRGASSFAINADERFHAASTMKVAVMVQVFRDIDAGRLTLRQDIPVANRFHSLVGDTTFALDPADDSETDLYRQVGRTVRLSDLVSVMITRSSNLATNILIAQVGADRVQATLDSLGIDSMTVRRGVEDGPAYRAGLNNTTTARALGLLFSAIAEGRAASPASCGRMLDILLHQRFKDAIPAGLPRGTHVAHKTGWITALEHDGGVVYWRGRPQYVLVVLTRGIQDRTVAARLIADLAGIVHPAMVPESVR